jgi:DNA mismatch repair protein MutL
MALEAQRTADVAPARAASVPLLERLPMLRVLGQVRQSYIIAEGPDGLYLIDQHAAHERILFEQLQAEQSALSISSQALLEPLTLELSPRQRGLIEPMLPLLASLGFDLASFGADTYLIRAVPGAVRPEEARAVITELLDVTTDGTEASVTYEALDIIACHSAVRAGQILTLEESRELIQQLEKTTSPYTCPHGRPTMIHLSSLQLEKSFGRR